MAVVGSPDAVSASLSPRMWNQAFDELGFTDFDYVGLPLENADAVTAFLRALSDYEEGDGGDSVLTFMRKSHKAVHNLIGFNVTMPFKELVAANLPADTLTERATQCGSVNTVVIEGAEQGRGAQLRADTTDGAAVIEGLVHSGIKPEDAEVTIVGAGGSARSVAFALADAGVASLLIYNRSLETAEKLAVDLQNFFSDLHIQVAGKMPIPVTAHVLISAVPGSFWSNSQDHLQRLHVSQACVDLSYDGRSTQATELMKTVRAQGAKGIDGREILARQAALAFAFVFGVEPPTEVMLRAAR